MAFEIREIQPTDDAQLAAIIRQVLIEFGANRPGFAWADPELDTLSAAYAGKGSVYYVVMHQQAVIGGAGIAPFSCETPNVCELQKMYLLPASRGLGIGQTLMHKLLQAAQIWGYRGCYIETFDTMQGAMRLYEKSGFKALSEPLGNSGHGGCNRFYLRWLNSPDSNRTLV